MCEKRCELCDMSSAVLMQLSPIYFHCVLSTCVRNKKNRSLVKSITKQITSSHFMFPPFKYFQVLITIFEKFSKQFSPSFPPPKKKKSAVFVLPSEKPSPVVSGVAPEVVPSRGRTISAQPSEASAVGRFFWFDF